MHLILAATLLAATSPASAQAPPDLRDLIGAQADAGEAKLREGGYNVARTVSPTDTDDTTYWWNEAKQRCIAVATRDGRYRTITIEQGNQCDSSAAYAAGDPGYGGSAADERSQRRSGYDDRQADRAYDRGAVLSFLCYGNGSNPDVRAASGGIIRDRTGARERYDGDAEVEVEIWGSRGRIFMGASGWHDLENVRAISGRISGRFSSTAITQARVEIDQRTGRIRIEGAQPFRGACDLGENNSQRRRY